MLGPLGRNAPDGLTDGPPAGSLSTGILGRKLTLMFRRSTELIGEPQGNQGLLGTAGHAGRGLAATILGQAEGERVRFWDHGSTITNPRQIINHVLTTMC
jgi:hypothetical protein